MAREVKLIPNYIYFYHLDEFCVLPLYPESITDRMETSFNSQNALSRSAPVFTFQHSGPRSVHLSFELHRDLMNDLNINVSNIKKNVVDFSKNDYIDILINYLQAAALPKYQIYSSGSKSVIPPMVAVRFGNDVFIKGVVNSGVSVTFKKPILSNNKYAVVDIDFTISEVDPYDADTVKQVGSFRGISETFKNGIYRTTVGGSTQSTYTSGSDNVQNSSGSRDIISGAAGTTRGASTKQLLSGDYLKVPGIDKVLPQKKTAVVRY